VKDSRDIAFEESAIFERLREVIAEEGDLEGSSFSGVFDEYLAPLRERFIADEARFRNRILAARERYAAAGVPPTERQQQAIANIERALSMLDQFLKRWPFFIIKRVLLRLAEAEHEATPEMVDQVRTAFTNSDVIQKSEIKHFLNLLTTEDALGIILRGHVLVENALDQCIVASFVHHQRLHDDLKMFYGEKVKLAHALGLIDDNEEIFLSSLGSIRNKLVHYEATATRPRPRYFVTADEEARLWGKFRAMAIGGPWPEYDAGKFPYHLKLLLAGLYMLLTTRSQKIRPGVVREREHIIDQYFVTALTLFTVRHYLKLRDIIEALAGDYSQGANPPTNG